MKLAEALVIRADLQNKISELETRLENNATIMEGEIPSESPVELLDQLDNALQELELLIAAINLTNAVITKDGKTMTELLAKRDCLKRRHGVMRSFLDNASMRPHRTRANEIVVKSTISVSDIQKSLDVYAVQLRQLELKIQAMNWENELLEHMS